MSKTPWEETWTANGRVVCRQDGRGNAYVLAAMSGPDDMQTVLATCRLAAAAPELYRALEQWAKEECSCMGGIPHRPCKHDLTWNVLRKARGE